MRRSGIIEKRSKEPRSYIITDKRTIRRNRYHLIPIKGKEEEDDYDLEDMRPNELETPEETDKQAEVPVQIPPTAVFQQDQLISRSGRILKKPKRFIEDC